MTGVKQPSQTGSAKLGVLSLACITFFSVSGGPFGTEDAITAAGALPVLLGLLILPILWAIPESMVTAELSTAFPEDSGFVAWCTVAFGPFWGWMEGWLALISNVINNAAYPVIVVEYMALAFPVLADGWPRIVFLFACTFLLVLLNYLGLEVVGWGQVVNAIFVMSPFLVLMGFCAKDFDASRWGHVVKPTDWETWINVMFWNLNYWSYAATLAGEVKNPRTTFPLALGVAICMVVASYLIPIGSVTSVRSEFGDSSVGMYGQVAAEQAGNWLKIWVVCAAVASGIGLFESSLTSSAYMVYGMAERGFFPKIFYKKSKTFNTPVVGIWWQLLPVFALTNLDFAAILSMINVIFSMSIVIGFGAMLWLRIRYPTWPRPYRMPGNVVWVAAALFPGFALLVWVMIIPFYKVQVDVIICEVVTLAVGVVLYPILQSKIFRKYVPMEPVDQDYMSHMHPIGLEEPATFDPNIRVGDKGDVGDVPVKDVV